MKKIAIISICLFSIFSLTILINTILSLDFINSSSKCKIPVDYSSVQIPALLEEELHNESDLHNGDKDNHEIPFSSFLPNLELINSFISRSIFSSISINNDAKTFFSDYYFIQFRNLRI